jgi:DNA-binding transcriptional LysR family regulator
MEMRQLELFVAVAEEGSIHAGARRALAPQPSVSKMLSKLERQLGTTLFVRSPQGVALTRAGEALLEEARGILARFNRLADVVGAAANEQRTLTVGLLGGAVAAAELTGEIVREFGQRFADVALRFRELTFDQQFEAVAEGQVDVAIVRPPMADARLDLVPILEEPRVLCCRSDHRLADATELSVDDILDEAFVNLDGAPRHWRSFWQLDEERHRPARTSRYPAMTPSELQFALLAGDVVMPVALSAWRIALGTDALRSIVLRDAPPSQVAVAVARENTKSLPAAFAECALDVCRKEAHLVPQATPA